MMEKIHKPMLFAIIGIVLLGAVLLIVQMWAPFIGWDTFFKLMVTFAILIVLAGFLLVVGNDLGQHKKLKDDNYLD